jgi:hypothetical protein
MNADIIRLLFSKLDSRSAARCLRVCKYWREVVNEEFLNELKRKFIRKISVKDNFHYGHPNKQFYCQECNKDYIYPRGVYHYSSGLCPLLDVEYLIKTKPFTFKRGLKYEADFYKRKNFSGNVSDIPTHYSVYKNIVIKIFILATGLFLIKNLK